MRARAMLRNSTINKLLSTTPQLWKGRRTNHAQPTLATGNSGLDAQLPGNGWPLGAVSELICAKPGLGEFSLLLPALARMSKQGQWIIMIDPPWIPYPASLHGHGLSLRQLLLVRTGREKESLWACEQALSNGRSGAVLAWPKRISFTHLRRLQLAAGSSGKLAFLFRPEQALTAASPAALRLQLEPDSQHGTRINILKCRGGRTPEPAYCMNELHLKEASATCAKKYTRHLLARHTLPTPGAESADPWTGQEWTSHCDQ